MQASLSTRLGQYWGGIPSVTAALGVVCSGIYLGILFLGYDAFEQVCFLPSFVVGKFQVYRVYTSVLFHQNILHLVFNMLAFIPIGSGLERMFGSVRYFHVLLLLATSNALLHLAVAYMAAYNFIHPFPSLLYECGIGLSGVIFSLVVIETTLSGIENRNIFGLFNVPAKWYVWVLLLVFQFFMPHVSFLAHLSGIISGYLYVLGVFNAVLLAPSTYVVIEESSFLAPLVRRQGFILGGSAVVSTLPSFSLPSVATSGTIWRRLESVIPRQQQPTDTDERFPGRGRTLGGNVQPPVQSAGAAVSSTHVSSVPPPKPQPTPDVDRPVSKNPQGGTDSALHTLVAMGFQQDQAAFALAATNGDVQLAVEVLSSQG